MATAVSARVIWKWMAQRLTVGVDLRWLAPVAVLVTLFKLAISDGGRHLPTLTLAQAIVYVMLIVLMLRGAMPRIFIATPLFSMVVIVTASATWSVRPEASIREGLLWLLYVGILVITASTLTSAAAARRFVDGCVAIAGWLCLIALFMFWGNNTPGMRWYSTFYWPNPFAGFLLLVLPIELMRVLRAGTGRAALAHGATAVLLMTSLLLTYSRGAWLALLATAPVMVALLRPLSWWAVVRRGVVLAGVVALAVLLLTRGAATPSVQGVLGRAASTANVGDYSWQGRLHFWRAALAIFRDHPVLGTGAGTFGAAHAAYQQDVRFYASDAHNLYLQTSAELGLLGLVAFIVLLGVVAAVAMRAVAHARGKIEYPVVTGTAIGVLAFLLHSGLDMNWRFPANPALLFALVGVLSWYDHALPEREPAYGARARARLWSVAMASIVAVALTITLVFQSAERAFLSAQALARRSQWAAATNRYAHAARRNPLSARYRGAYAVAVVQTDPSQRQTAEALLGAAMRLDRMNASHPLHLARLIMDRTAATPAQLAEAEMVIQRALRLDPWNRPEAYRLLARIYLRQGRIDDADRIYSEAAARYLGQGLGAGSIMYLLLWPDVVGLVLDAADAWVARRDLERARDLLEALLREDPRAAPAAIQLSRLYLALGRPEQARAVLQQTATLVQDNAAVRAALESLP